MILLSECGILFSEPKTWQKNAGLDDTAGNRSLPEQAFYQGITLRMHGTVVERILGSRDAKEAGTLLES